MASSEHMHVHAPSGSSVYETGVPSFVDALSGFAPFLPRGEPVHSLSLSSCWPHSHSLRHCAPPPPSTHLAPFSGRGRPCRRPGPAGRGSRAPPSCGASGASSAPRRTGTAGTGRGARPCACAGGTGGELAAPPGTSSASMHTASPPCACARAS